MNIARHRTFSPSLFTAGMILCLCGAISEGSSISLDEAWAVPFAGQPAEIEATVRLEPGQSAFLGWELSVSRSVVARGELPLAPSTETIRAVPIPFQMPSIRPDVRLPAEFRVYLIGENRKHLAETQRRFPILGDNPFPSRAAELRALRIVLFDPIGATADTLEKADIPFGRIHGLSGFGEERPGLLLVGETLSFRDTPDLPELLHYAIQHQIPMLCLPPRNGTLPLPFFPAETDGIGAIRLAHRQAVPVAGKDQAAGAEVWGAAGPPISGTMCMTHSQNGIVGDFTTETKGWPWFEADYADRPGRWIVSGIGILAVWDQTPAARWLLLEWIEYAAGTQKETK